MPNNTSSYSGKIEFYHGESALAFSDVYIKPVYSDIKSRYSTEIDTSTVVSRNSKKLRIPLISAGMDTVTEDGMATQMALLGGLGEIHRNCSVERQVEMVRKVKEKMRMMAKNPPKVSEKDTIGYALSLLKSRNRGYVVVYKGNKYSGKITGIATDKDFLAGDENTRIKDIMTPLKGKGRRKLITGRVGMKLEEAVQVMIKERVEKLPVIDDDGFLLGVYTLKDYFSLKEFPNASLDDNGRLMVGAAIGVQENIDIERTLKLAEAGCDFLFLDIAHGHSIHTEKMMKRIKNKENIKTPVIVGNFATYDGVSFAYNLGADGVKVGIGPGYVCKTRSIAGTGIPQITAVLEASRALNGKKDSPTIISDGGIREPGDTGKAISAGADSVMIGSVLAGTAESPGDVVKINGSLQKRIRGMASLGVLEERKKLSESTTDITVYAPEGRETFTPYKGSVKDLIMEYLGGLRSSMSYAGVHTITDMHKSKLVRISAHGASEHTRSLS